ncbi:MAG: ATP-binding protein [Pseudomonadota bacterium]|nr:ATP-binding protein [Pseudomonadota bacterium]
MGTDLPGGNTQKRLAAEAEASAVERDLIAALMDEALGLRAKALDERAFALAEGEARLRQREESVWARKDAQRVIDIAIAELETHNAELRAANEKLIMATLNAQELRDAAQAARRRQEEFLAMLAHELRNPLGPIITAVGLLSRLGAKPVPEAVLGMIRRQVQQMVRLLDDLLDAARVTEGKVTLQISQIDVADFIQQAVETCRDLIAAKGQRLSIDLPDESLAMNGDPARLVQVVTNLLQNAAKYTGDGGEIKIGASRQGDKIVLRVRDSGIGISPETLPHVFDLFVQDQRGLSRSEGGLGIGLTVVRRMVDLHGGVIEAFSKGRDQGSEFVVTLPGVDRRSAVRPTPLAAVTLAPTATRILVVEDNVDAGDALAELLRISGHEVEVARDGFAGIARFEQSRPRVVLCDIGLPGINGYEVAQRMRSSRHEPRPALIAITGYGDQQASERALAAGFDRHVVKPVNPDALLRLVESAVSAEDWPASSPGTTRHGSLLS